MFQHDAFRSSRRRGLALPVLLLFFSLGGGTLLAKGPLRAEPVTLEGTVQVLTEDRRDGSREVHVLDAEDGGRYEIQVEGPVSAGLRQGARVRVSGLRTGNRIAVESAGDIESVQAGPGLSTQSSQAIFPNTFGAQRTVVILVNFSNAATQPYSASYARTVMTSASNFDLENSYGQTWLTADVYGWFTIALSSTVCDYTTLASQAQSAATKAGVNLGNYTRQVYAFPQNACTWWGLGGPGNLGYSQAWINGDLEEQVVAHEMGHGFGLQHSHSLDCGTVALGTNCTVSDYGDIFDTMGQSAYHFSASQKERLGWLNYGASPPIRTVTASGTYAIDPYETTGSLPKALKIARGTTGTYFYVEARRAVGFDAGLSSNSNVLNGVLIHLNNPNDSATNDLLDMTPATASWNDPALAVGQTFTDSTSGVSITTSAIGASGATVAVTLGGTAPPCSHVAPVVSLTSGAASGVAAGTMVPYTMSVTNADSAATCTASTFQLSPAVPSGWSAGFSTASLSIAPGATATATLSVTSPAGALDGAYAVSATAANAAASTAAASGSSSYTVSNPPVGGGTFTDNFNRPDSATPGNGWVEAAGNFSIASNELRTALISGTNIVVQPTLTGATQTASADFASVDNSARPRLGVILRYQDSQNYYILYRNISGGGSRKLRISRIVNGAETYLAQVSDTNPAVNTFFNISGRIQGTTLVLALDGVDMMTATDATFSTGAVGISLSNTSTTKAFRADNFTATVQ